ncbi:MAG: hypothetical protein U0176_25860 [Bacteroidia bacterium]
MSIIRYSLLSVAIMAVIMLATWLLREQILPPGSTPFALGAIALSSISGIVAYAIVYSGIEKRITLFTAYVSGSMLIKMVIGMLGVFLVALKYKPYAAPFVLSYFFCYFVFTSLEVYWLMRKLRPISKKGVRESQNEEPNT